MSIAKRDMAANILIKTYKELKPNCGYVQISSFAGESTVWTDKFFVELMRFSKREFHIKNIISLACKDIPQYATTPILESALNKKGIFFHDKTGLFKIEFSTGDILIFAKWLSGGGKSTVVESMFATEMGTWKKWFLLFKEERTRQVKPKIGIYKIEMDSGGVLHYNVIKKIPNNKIFHSELTIIEDSIQYYFNNVASFMKYNQPGRRSLLLYGEQGTSKTSTLYCIALAHKKDKCIVFAEDISCLARHIKMCEKYSVPTLCFLEDAEGIFSQNNSSIKNFLSGIDAKQNKAGTCIVYTTNYPERMEETIIERPERIDELYYIGPIEGKMLIDCVKFYFGENLPPMVNLEKIFTKAMTGAEVKLLIENTLKYCAAKQMDIDENAIVSVLNKYSSDIKKLKQFSENAKKTYAKNANKKEPVGFGNWTEELMTVTPVTLNR